MSRKDDPPWEAMCHVLAIAETVAEMPESPCSDTQKESVRAIREWHSEITTRHLRQLEKRGYLKSKVGDDGVRAFWLTERGRIAGVSESVNELKFRENDALSARSAAPGGST